MALTIPSQSPSTGPIAVTATARLARFRAIAQHLLVLAGALLAVLVEQLHPAGAHFRIRHVAVISASLVTVFAAAVAGVFHR